MSDVPVDTRGFSEDHQRFALTANRLGAIASELDELSSTYVMEEWASRGEKQPNELLAQLVDVLSSFAQRLGEHFAREERYLPELAQRYNAAALADILASEHKDVLEVLQGLVEKARELVRLELSPSVKKARLMEITSALRGVLTKLSAHAEKEDEVLFISDHNV